MTGVRGVLISVAEAAAVLGLKSRGSIYRKVKSGELKTVESGDGTPLIERDGLEERWASITRLRTDSPKVVKDTVKEKVVEKKERVSKKKKVEEVIVEDDDDGPNGPDFNLMRARNEKEKWLTTRLNRLREEERLVYKEDMEIAYNAVFMHIMTRAQALHKLIKSDIPELTHSQISKIEKRISDMFESISESEFEEIEE